MRKIILASSALTQRLSEVLARLLARESGVFLAAGGVIRQEGGSAGTVIVSADAATRIEDKDAILLLPRDSILPEINAPLTLVADSARLDWPVGFSGELISCGLSGKDTFTLSSKRESGGVVALMRQIKSLSGRVIEPCEIPVLYSDKDPFVAFAAVCVLLLADCSHCPGAGGCEASNLQL